jgi:hypothetical protein
MLAGRERCSVACAGVLIELEKYEVGVERMVAANR